MCYKRTEKSSFLAGAPVIRFYKTLMIAIYRLPLGFTQLTDCWGCVGYDWMAHEGILLDNVLANALEV